MTVGGAGPQGLGPVCGDHCPALQAIASLAEKKRAIAKIVGIISGISSLYSELLLVLLAIFGYTVSANKKKNFLDYKSAKLLFMLKRVLRCIIIEEEAT